MIGILVSRSVTYGNNDVTSQTRYENNIYASIKYCTELLLEASDLRCIAVYNNAPTHYIINIIAGFVHALSTRVMKYATQRYLQFVNIIRKNLC